MRSFLRVLFPTLAMGLLLWLFLGRSKPQPVVESGQSHRKTAGNAAVAKLSDSSWEMAATEARSADSLATLRKRIKDMPADGAVASIESFLKSGNDHETSLTFEIGQDGTLTGWPTLRTFLLDLLLEIDPAAAARISRDLLGSPTTADEWAIGLRNVGRVEATAEARDFLRQKTEELIRNPAWQQQPSIGYLNAFDVLVYTEATASAPLLSEIVQRKDRRDLAHAGFLTLDRLVQRKPAEMLAKLAADPALHANRPEMVAQQFARADLRDLAQQTLVKSWLLDPTRTPLELRTFAETYPNNNQMISQNLLTSELQISGSDLAEHDREVMEIIKSWQTDPSFVTVKSHLLNIQQRLLSFSSENRQPSEPDQ